MVFFVEEEENILFNPATHWIFVGFSDSDGSIR